MYIAFETKVKLLSNELQIFERFVRNWINIYV